jgi:hypothetical protein
VPAVGQIGVLMPPGLADGPACGRRATRRGGGCLRQRPDRDSSLPERRNTPGSAPTALHRCHTQQAAQNGGYLRFRPDRRELQNVTSFLAQLRADRRLFVLRWNGGDGASMLRSSNSARSRPGATRHARRLLPHATYLLGVRTGSYPGSALCVALGVAQGLDPCADAPVHLAPRSPSGTGFQPGRSHRVATGARAGPC